jgi:hypothetical protein
LKAPDCLGTLRAMFRVWVWIAIGFVSASAAERAIQFSRMKADEPPPGFRSALTGEGRPGAWKILETEVPTAFGALTEKAETPRQNVLAQTGRDPTENRYPLLILEGEEFGEFTLTTRFKLHAGVVEQMAGIAFRIQNESNYFYIRASGLYNTLKFAKVENGQIVNPIGPEVPIEKGVWHELKIEAQGNQFNCWLNGKQHLPTITDASYRAGKIGFWTKSDSVTYFADTHISYVPRESLATLMVRDISKKYGRIKNIRIVGKKDGALQVLASGRAEEVGQPANDVEKDVFANDKKYVGKSKELKAMLATVPLHDKNGDPVAAVRFEMDPFPGQTEKNVLERTVPMIKEMQARVIANKELTAFQ